MLGPVELLAGGRRVAPGSRYQRKILAILLVDPGGTVDADRIVEALWEGRPPAAARKALQNHVARLRRVLADTEGADPGLVATEGAGYRMQLGDHEVDARRFETLLVEARAVEEPERVVARLDLALGLWRGPAFGEFAESDFVRAEAVRLEELRSDAAAARVDALLELGRAGEAIGALERLIAVAPFRERTHGQLMLALYRAGRQAEALATYRELHRRLGEDLGVDPGPELQRLYEGILRQDPVLEMPARRREAESSTVHGHGAAAPARRAKVGLRRPTPRRDRLVGRDTEVAELIELVATAPLVTLTGPGGVGKSRLADEVAARAGPWFDDGVVAVELAPLSDAGALEYALAGALGVAPGAGDPRERIVSALRGRRLLLVIDNCEHLLPSVAEVVDRLLRSCPALTVLATSRERLAVHGEHRHPVSPLEPPREADATDVDDLAGNAAVRLFCDRAAAVAPGFALTPANAGAIGEICRRLDGMPLALELAAARTAAVRVQDIAVRLGEDFGLLTGGPRSDGGRHRTLAGVVGWSYRLLADPEARLFDRLSVFAGAFTLEAAEQVCAGDGLEASDVAGHLAALVDKSMVLRAGGGYRLLETLRRYGHRRLVERGEADRMGEAHASFFAGFVEAAAPATHGPDGAAWLRHLGRALDNLRAAHRWAVDRGDADLALRLSAPLGPEAGWGLSDEVAGWAEEAAALPAARGHPLRPLAYGAAAGGAAFRGQFDRSVELARRGLEAAPDPADTRRMAPVLALCLVAIFQGRFAESDRLADELHRHATTAGDAYRAVFVHVARAMNATYRPDPDPAAARAHATRACADADALGNPQARAFAYYTRGEALADHDPVEALRWLEAGLDLARTVPVLGTEAMALLSISSIRARRGEPASALATFHEAVGLWRRAGDWAHQWTTLRNLAFLLARLHEDDAAAALLGATETSPTAARAYGADAQQVRTAEARLRRRLGDDRYERRWRAGARMTDDEVVAYALDRIDAARARTRRR